MALDYTTPAIVRDYLGISSTSDDPLLIQICEAAQSAVNRYTRREFGISADSTRYFDARGPHIYNRTLYFGYDLCAVTSITNGDGDAIAATDYSLIPRNVGTDPNSPIYAPYYAVRLLSNSTDIYWTYDTEWMDAIRIVGKWGYSVTVPNDIAQATMRLASFYYRQKDAQMYDTTVIEAGVVARPMAMPVDVRALLDRYIPLVT